VSARSALRLLGQDLRWLPRNLVVNWLAPAIWMPRLARLALYRLCGLQLATAHISEHCRFDGTAGITIGRGTFVNADCRFDAMAPIRIGRDCAIAMGVLVGTSTHRLTEQGFDPVPSGQPVTIGDRCWIGARATILPGVRIGDDVVIAAGAVVTGDCRSNSVYAGVPARRVRALLGGDGADEATATGG